MAAARQKKNTTWADVGQDLCHQMASLILSDLKCSYPDYEDGLIISGQWYQSWRSQCIFIEMCCAVPFLYYTVSFRQNIRNGNPKTRRSLFWGVSYKFEMWLMLWLLGLPLWIWYRITIDRAIMRTVSLQWRHNGFDGVSTHQPHHCLPNRVFRRRSKKTSKLRVTALCVGNSPVAGEFPTQMVCNAENVSIWWRHHVHWFSCLMHPNSVSHSLRTQCQPNSVSMSAHDAWWGEGTLGIPLISITPSLGCGCWCECMASDTQALWMTAG